MCSPWSFVLLHRRLLAAQAYQISEEHTAFFFRAEVRHDLSSKTIQKYSTLLHGRTKDTRSAVDYSTALWRHYRWYFRNVSIALEESVYTFIRVSPDRCVGDFTMSAVARSWPAKGMNWLGSRLQDRSIPYCLYLKRQWKVRFQVLTAAIFKMTISGMLRRTVWQKMTDVS